MLTSTKWLMSALRRGTPKRMQPGEVAPRFGGTRWVGLPHPFRPGQSEGVHAPGTMIKRMSRRAYPSPPASRPVFVVAPVPIRSVQARPERWTATAPCMAMSPRASVRTCGTEEPMKLPQAAMGTLDPSSAPEARVAPSDSAQLSDWFASLYADEDG